MNKELYMRIKKLKKPELAQPHCLRSFEEQKFLESINPDDLLFLNLKGDWIDWLGGPRCVRDTVILKPGYEPEPEYENREIVAISGYLVLKRESPGNSPTINNMVAMVGFVKFWLDEYDDGFVTLESVSTHIRNGKKIYARFVKVEK